MEAVLPTRLLNETEAARVLGLSPGTLRKLRSTGALEGGLPEIPFVRMGRAIRYDLRDLESLIDGLKAGAA